MNITREILDIIFFYVPSILSIILGIGLLIYMMYKNDLFDDLLIQNRSNKKRRIKKDGH